MYLSARSHQEPDFYDRYLIVCISISSGSLKLDKFYMDGIYGGLLSSPP